MRTLTFFLFITSLVSILLLYLNLTGVINILRGAANTYALSVGLLIPFSLLFLAYVQLRDIRIYLLWLVIGIGMLLFYYQFREVEVLQMKRGTALNSFKSLFWFLAVFQIGRFLFVKLTGREYVLPLIGGSSDLFEDKKPQLADFIMFGVLFFTIIAAQGV